MSEYEMEVDPMFRFGNRPYYRNCYHAADGGGTPSGNGAVDGISSGTNDGESSSHAAGTKYHVESGGVVEFERPVDGEQSNGTLSADEPDGTAGGGSVGGSGGGSGGSSGGSDGNGGGRNTSRNNSRRATGITPTIPAAGTGAGTDGTDERQEAILQPEKLVVDKPKSRSPQGAPKSAAPKMTSIAQKRPAAKAGDIAEGEVIQFLVGMFGVAATMGGAHWAIDDDDASTIAKPLTSILNKMNKKRKDNVTNAMAPMLLIVAIGTVVVPRMMITLSIAKEKKTYAQSRANANQNTKPVSAADTEVTGITSGHAEGQKQQPANEDGSFSSTAVPSFIANFFSQEH